MDANYGLCPLGCCIHNALKIAYILTHRPVDAPFSNDLQPSLSTTPSSSLFRSEYSANILSLRVLQWPLDGAAAKRKAHLWRRNRVGTKVGSQTCHGYSWEPTIDLICSCCMIATPTIDFLGWRSTSRYHAHGSDHRIAISEKSPATGMLEYASWTIQSWQNGRTYDP